MLRHTLIRAFALSLPLLMFACRGVPNPDYAFLGRFQKGEQRAVIDSIKNSDPKFSFDFSADGSMKATTVDMYKMILSTKTPFIWALLGIPVSKTQYDFIVFAYQNNTLVYCGTPDDFKKSTNPEISAISARLNDALLKEF